jgi:hypothetical protein
MPLSVRVCLPSASAQAREVTAAVVIPVHDATGSRDPMLVAKATDALALALEDSKSYRVISKQDVERELRAQDLTPPLNENEQQRVGTALQADRVFTATLTALAVDPRSGAVRAGLDLRSYNVAIGAVLDGANVEITTKPIPGWSGDPVPVINEALRQVAEQVVADMERSHVRHGSVYLVDEQGVITTDLGVNDGVQVGTQLLVERGYWDKSQEKTIMRPIGEIELTGVQVRLSQAKKVSGQVPRIGDRVYVLYSPPSVVKAIQRGRQTTSTLRLLAAVGVIMGIVATGTGSQNISPPGASAYLAQQSPNATPVIRVNISRGLNPDPEHTHAFLFYRGSSAGFVADATAGGTDLTTGGPLIAVVPDGHLNYYEDSPDRQVGLSADITFQYFDRTGEQQDGTLTATYNHAELVAGNSYYYKVRRLVDPWRPILPNPTQVVPPFVNVTFTVDPQDALGDPSQATGPVTYSLPATPLRPLGSTTVDPKSATFEWAPARGADQYQVQIYSDAALTHLVTSSPILTSAAGQSTMHYTFSDYVFPGSTLFYWVVASRTSGEVNPVCTVGGRTVPFVLSEKENFTTVTLPPGPAVASVASGRPSGVRGWWNERRVRGPRG